MAICRIIAGCALLIGFSAAAAQPPTSPWDPKVSQTIDAHLLKVLKEKGLTPAPPAGDAEFVRRVYLDLLGRIPTVEETEAYLKDTAADKHHRLIDALLVHAEMPIYWKDVINHWLNGRESKPGLPDFRAWLHKGLAENKPWDQLARELVNPDGNDPEQQPASYFIASRLNRPADERLDAVTSAVSAGLFGVRLECAKCHDHPMVDDWKQDHYYGLASFFNRTEAAQAKNKPALGERADGQVTFVNTDRETKTARLMFLDNKVFDEPLLSKNVAENYLVPPQGKTGGPAVPRFSRRKALADHAFTKDNPFFKKAIVNRVWKQFLGRGLVEPVDQMHSANPATHPELLDWLADDFAAHQFDLRRLMAGILHSEAYRRSSIWIGKGDRPEDSGYAVGLLKPLTPEQLGLSVYIASGHADSVANKLKGKSVDAVRAELDKDLKLFIERYDSDAAQFQATTPQALFMTYNPAAQKLLSPPDGLSTRMTRLADHGAVARIAYRTILSRPPVEDEVEAVVRYLDSGKQPRAQLCRDVLWGLLNSAEFRFNH